MRPHPPEVRSRAQRLYKQGWSYKQIGRELDVSAQAVARWCDPDRAERNRLSSQLYKLTKARKGVCADCGGPTDWSRKKPAERCQRCHLVFMEKLGPTWTRERIIETIQRWVKENGRPPTAPQWRRSGPWWPSYGSVYGHPKAPFKTWRAAIQAAGYDTPAFTHNTVGPGKRRWSLDEGRKLRQKGLSDKEIGERYGITASAIYQALGPRGRLTPVKKKRAKKLKNRSRAERIADLQKALAKQQ